MKFDQFHVGMEVRYQERIEAADVDKFAQLSGDYNELHINPDFARQAGFRDRVVHGAFLIALVSRLIGMKLPGPHSVLLSLRLDFVAPTFPEDTVEVIGQIESLHPDQRVVALRVKVTCGNETRARGSALVKIR